MGSTQCSPITDGKNCPDLCWRTESICEIIQVTVSGSIPTYAEVAISTDRQQMTVRMGSDLSVDDQSTDWQIRPNPVVAPFVALLPIIPSLRGLPSFSSVRVALQLYAIIEARRK